MKFTFHFLLFQYKKAEDKVRLGNFRKECQEAVEIAKLNYLTNMGDKLSNPNTSRKSYWKLSIG